MLLAVTASSSSGSIALSLPIVFALGTAAVVGLVIGGYSLEMVASSLIGASQNWVLLAIPSFIFAGTVMERCGMSNALVDLARALVGWLRGGLGMSVIVVSYFFSDICGSKMAEVSALGSTLMPPLRRAGYRAEDGASLIASGTAMGMLVPPAIFMIVIGEVTNTSVVALFLAGFIPAAVIGVCLCLLVLIQAHLLGWPKDTRPSLALSAALVARSRGAAGHPAGDPRRVLSRRLHRDRGGRDRRALFAAGRAALLPQPVLGADPAASPTTARC